MKPKYNIGDPVYFAEAYSSEHQITCPDCGGTKFLTVTLWNEEKFTIDCEGCKKGYLGPVGVVRSYKYTPKVTNGIISGISTRHNEIEYTIDYYYSNVDSNGHHYGATCGRQVAEKDVFTNFDACFLEATALVLKHEQEQEEKINHKEKTNKSWSWHVHYYRKQIRDAKKEIEHAEKCLNVARAKAKEPEETIS